MNLILDLNICVFSTFVVGQLSLHLTFAHVTPANSGLHWQHQFLLSWFVQSGSVSQSEQSDTPLQLIS